MLIAVALGQLGNRSLDLPRMRLDSIGAGPGSRLKRLALLDADCDFFAEPRAGDAGLHTHTHTCTHTHTTDKTNRPHRVHRAMGQPYCYPGHLVHLIAVLHRSILCSM